MMEKVVVESTVVIRGSSHKITLVGVDATQAAKAVKDAISELESAVVAKEQKISH